MEGVFMSKNIIIVGAVALGSKAACRAKRLDPKANVTLIDQSDLISYGGCGIPFYVSGDVSDVKELRTTSYHMVRDEAFFETVKDVKVLTGTRVLSIDRASKSVRIRKRDGAEDTLPYDKLVLGTGASPRKLDVPGGSLDNIFTASNLDDAQAIKSRITGGQIEKAVIVGAGFIGLEMAEALADMWEIDTTVVEFCDQIMPGFVSKDLARMAQKHMEDQGVSFHLNEVVEAFEGETTVTAVKTNKRVIPADLVIVGIGVTPGDELAREAGLETSPRGGIVVNDMLQTSDPDIYSGGDCALVKNLITGKPGFYPLGSMANRQGRVIGTNVTGGNAGFKGAVGSFVIKLFETSLAGAGLSIQNARKEGYDAASVQITQFDRAHFYPEKELMHLELVFEKGTRRVLGIQGFGGKNDAMVGRINAVASILSYKPTVEDISNIELAYSPPFASAMDILNALGNVADNFLDGKFRPIDSDTFAEYWENRDTCDVFFLDCREELDARPFVAKYPEHWTNIPQDELRQRIEEVARDKKIVLVCNTGVRSYEAQLNLYEFGLEDNVTVQNGMAGIQKSGVDI